MVRRARGFQRPIPREAAASRVSQSRNGLKTGFPRFPRFLTFLAAEKSSVEVDDDRRLGWIVLLVAGRGVDELHTELLADAVAAVDVAEDVEVEPSECGDLLDPFSQFLAAGVLVPSFARYEIENAERRAVSDEDVDVIRDHRPLLGKLRTAVQVEGPIEKSRLPWRSVDMQAVYLDR